MKTVVAVLALSLLAVLCFIVWSGRHLKKHVGRHRA